MPKTQLAKRVEYVDQTALRMYLKERDDKIVALKGRVRRLESALTLLIPLLESRLIQLKVDDQLSEIKALLDITCSDTTRNMIAGEIQKGKQTLETFVITCYPK